MTTSKEFPDIFQVQAFCISCLLQLLKNITMLLLRQQEENSDLVNNASVKSCHHTILFILAAAAEDAGGAVVSEIMEIDFSSMMK